MEVTMEFIFSLYAISVRTKMGEEQFSRTLVFLSTQESGDQWRHGRKHSVPRGGANRVRQERCATIRAVLFGESVFVARGLSITGNPRRTNYSIQTSLNVCVVTYFSLHA